MKPQQFNRAPVDSEEPAIDRLKEFVGSIERRLGAPALAMVELDVE